MINQKEESLKAKKYTSASLIIFVILLISAQIVRQIQLSKQISYASLINTSGKQRAFSQLIGKNIIQNKSFDSFELDFQQFKEAHKKLTKGSLTSSSTLKKSLALLYQDLNNTFIQIEKEMNCYKKSECQSNERNLQLIKHLDLFLKKMDNIVYKKTTFSENAINNSKAVEFTIFIFLIVIFLIILINIITPMQKKLLTIIDDYIRSKEINTKIEQAALIGTWSYDLKKEIIERSDEIYKIYSLNKNEQVTTSTILNQYKESDRKILKHYLTDPNEYKKRFNKDFEFTDGKGNKKWLRTIGEPIFDSNNNIIKIAGLLQDITEIKKQENQLKQTSELLLLAIEGADIAIWKWDLLKNKVECDKNWYQLYGIEEGFPENDLKRWKSITHPTDLKKTISEFKKFSTSNKKTFESIHRAKDENGNWKYILSRGKFSNDCLNGKPAYFLGTCQDITDTIKTENEQKFILESLNLGVWKWNMNSNELTWDDNLYDLFGYPKDDYSNAYNTWIASLGHRKKETISELKEELTKCLKENKDLETDFPIITKSGEIRFIGVKATVEKSLAGRAISMYGINWDKTNEINAKKKLEQSLKLANIGEIAAGVGHEINNPLLIIKGYLGILKKESASVKIEKMLDATKRIEQIVSGLRQFSRATEDDKATIDLNQILKTTCDTMIELYSKEDVQLELSLGKSNFCIGNIGRIQQVVVNLITNAKDAVICNDNAQIHVNLKEIGGFHHIKVKDNGSGIPKELQSRVFTPFFSTKDVNDGTGIGLSLAYSITKEHGGTLSFESDEKGTTFTLSLPTIPNTSQLKEAPLEESETKNQDSLAFETKSKKLNVMCIDDERDILDILEFYLSEMDINTTSFSNSIEAYDELTKNNYDLVITDLQMPKLSGMELIRKVRENEKIHQPKIIISTGGVNINIEDKTNELTSMVSSYIFKPYNIEELKKSIDDCIS